MNRRNGKKVFADGLEDNRAEGYSYSKGGNILSYIQEGEIIMKIERDTEYKGTPKKYKVWHDGIRYTAYIQPCNSLYPIVCVGDGISEGCTDVTDTKIGMEIILSCNNLE